MYEVASESGWIKAINFSEAKQIAERMFAGIANIKAVYNKEEKCWNVYDHHGDHVANIWKMEN